MLRLVTLLLGAVVPVASFIIGCCTGALLWRKPWPPEYDNLADAIDLVESELGKTDSAVIKLRQRANYSDNAGRVLITASTPNTEGPEDVLTTRLLQGRNRLAGFRMDLENLVPFLEAVKIRPQIVRVKEAGPQEVSTTSAESEFFEENLNLKGDAISPDIFEVSVEPETDHFAGAIRPEEIVGLYNRAVNDPVFSARFRERYQPLRIGTINAVERRQNPTIKEEFKETTDGDFFAIPIVGKEQHAVVPRLGLTIEAISLNAGALAKVFNILEYDAKGYYSRYSVKHPAIFKNEGDRWELELPGEMELGPGDDA